MTYRAWEQKPLDRTTVRELTAAIAEQAAAQLEEQAMDEAPWSDEKYKAVLAAQQKENALLAGILAARGITDPAEALTLLAGEEALSDPALLTDMDAAALADILIVSQVRVDVGAEQSVAVRPANGAKCLRCWKVLPTVGSDAGHPDLCPRCAAVVKKLPVIE